MVLPHKVKRWIKWLFALIAAGILFQVVLYWLVAYRFKDITKILIEQETNGAYTFDASSVNFSLFKRNIILKNAVLVCNNKLKPVFFDVEIPEVYLSIASWRELILEKKVSVDSLSIISPYLKVYDQSVPDSAKAKTDLRLSTSIKGFSNILSFLKVRSFDLKDGSFEYHTQKTETVFSGNTLNLSVRNLSRQNTKDNRLLFSDDIELTIGEQHWTLPDGLHTIDFKRLHFSGRNQHFELDSCRIHVAANNNKGEMDLWADNFFFNSVRLTSLYEKDELLIDTLVCIRPVMQLEQKSNKNWNSKHQVVEVANQMFNYINFKYIEVEEGQLFMKKSQNDLHTATYVSQKSNLRIYNLSVQAEKKPYIQVDSILIGLRNISFLSKDKLYEVVAEELTLANNDLILKNVTYGPSSENHSGKALSFTSSALRLKNFSLDALINKKLRADDAELIRPVIVINNKKQASKVNIAPPSIAHFYKILHGLRELIGVPKLKIVNGQVNYSHSDPQAPLKVVMQDINADVLPIHFLNSDSLVDIKHSIPKLTVSQVTVAAKGVNIKIDNFRFDGLQKKNYADHFMFTQENGSVIEGTGVYWNILDWDLYQQHEVIQITDLEMKDLVINLQASGRSKPDSLDKKTIPEIRILNLGLEKLHLISASEKQNIRLEGSLIKIDSLNSKKGDHFVWSKAKGQFSNIHFNNGQLDAGVTELIFDSESESVLRGLVFSQHNSKGTVYVALPLLKAHYPLYSTAFSHINLHSLTANQPIVKITSIAEKDAPENHPFSMPANINVDKFAINQASIQFQNINEKDTVNLTSQVTIHGSALAISKKADNRLQYDKLKIELNDLQFRKEKLETTIPAASLELQNGQLQSNKRNKLQLKTATFLKWQGMTVKHTRPDSSTISANDIGGTFNDSNFVWGGEKREYWQTYFSKLTIHEGNVIYSGKKSTFNAKTIAWNPAYKEFSITEFQLLPKLSREETSRNNKWQKDYITVKGEAIKLQGVQLTNSDEETFVIRKIILDRIVMSSTRDKRMPFRHKREKPMPTKLINTIPFPLRIDSVEVRKSQVTVHEISAVTSQEGVVPLEEINAVITNISNRSNGKLQIRANAKLFNSYIRNMEYEESYADSLSSFSLRCNMSPVKLTELSPVTIPLASVSIDNGYADTVYAAWKGNKYAAIGTMHFYYKDLQIHLLDKQDTTQKRNLLVLETMLANSVILNKNNSKKSLTFFERDREKFVFNYWVKTLLQGSFSSIGLKKDKKFLKHYKQVYLKYHLPAKPDLAE